VHSQRKDKEKGHNHRMNSLKVILLIGQTAIFFQSGWSHKCFVCGPEGGKPEDLYQLKKSFPNMVVPSCSKYKQSNKDQYLIDCPPGLSNGCLTKFEENGSIMRTCAPIAIEDCKKANGINYCYCKKEGCNTPERRLSDPERTGKQAGGAEKKFLDHSEAGHVPPSVSRFSDLHLDDEDLTEGSGEWGDFYYDDYNYGNYGQEDYGDMDADQYESVTSHAGLYGSYPDDTEPDDGREDYADVTNPPPFLDLEGGAKGPKHKFDRNGVRGRPNDIIIVEDGEPQKPKRKKYPDSSATCISNPLLLVMIATVTSSVLNMLHRL